jgi:hypothetical protein
MKRSSFASLAELRDVPKLDTHYLSPPSLSEVGGGGFWLPHTDTTRDRREAFSFANSIAYCTTITTHPPKHK